MLKKYYIDTAIWIDLLEDRKGYHKEPLGDYALKLFTIIKLKNHSIILSDILLQELKTFYSNEELSGMIAPFKKQIIKIFTTKHQILEAKNIAKLRNLPKGDVLHAILARDNETIMITRDKHFLKLRDVIES